jgi:O-antigen/teichoic acid export membrane protein
MLKSILYTTKIFVTTGETRSLQAKKNIIASFCLKAVSIAVSLLLVPLTLRYLNPTEYGIWLTLSSILTWINFFDIGLGNGLRNKLTEALSFRNIEKAKVYVSTTFAILFLIMAVFFVMFISVNPLLDWSAILKTSPEASQGLSSVVVVVFAFFCLQFIFKTVGIIFIAQQKPALNDLLGVLGNVLSLIIIYILTLCTSGSLYKVAVAFSAAPLVVFLLAYIFVFYFSKYQFLRPTWGNVKKSSVEELMGLGVQFFLIQVAGLIMHATSNLIIIQTLGAEEVTVYNVAYRYFSIAIMVFSIIQSSLWNMYTDAWVKQDYGWIKRIIKKMIKMWILLSGTAFLMLLISNFIYRMWIGEDVTIPFTLSLWLAVLVVVNNWSSLWVNLINGIGKLRLQLYTSVFSSVAYIPIALLFCKQFGITGIVLSSIVAMLPGVLICPIQFNKIINYKAYGVWNK